MNSGGVLLLAATPIGNTGDASPRLLDALQNADIVAAEDTRRAVALAQRLGIRIGGRLASLYEHNEAVRSGEIVEAAAAGATVVIVTDAGMPTVSDPGFRVARAAIDAGIPVSVIPGPSAVLASLAVAGLPTDRFSFEGFLPRRAGDRDRVLGGLARDERTMVFFESPRRVGESLDAMARAFGAERDAVVCRELTKTHEEILRGTLGELAERTVGGVLGEVTIVVAGAAGGPDAELGDAVADVGRLVDLGVRLKDAAAFVAEKTGLRSRELYQRALELRVAGDA